MSPDDGTTGTTTASTTNESLYNDHDVSRSSIELTSSTLLHPQTQSYTRLSPFPFPRAITSSILRGTESASPRPTTPRASLKELLRQTRENAINQVRLRRATPILSAHGDGPTSLPPQSPLCQERYELSESQSEGLNLTSSTLQQRSSVFSESSLPADAQGIVQETMSTVFDPPQSPLEDAMDIDEGSVQRDEDSVNSILSTSTPEANVNSVKDTIPDETIQGQLSHTQHLYNEYPSHKSETSMEQSHQVDNATTILQPQHSSINSHLVLLPIMGVARDMYSEIIKKNKSAITSVMHGYDTNHSMYHVSNMLSDLKLLCNHPDLVVHNRSDLVVDLGESLQRMNDQDMSRWSQSCSTKCLFLGKFLRNFKDEEKHLAILADKGRTLDIIEAILKDEKLNYSRPDKMSSYKRSYDPLQVSLLPTSGDARFVVRSAHLVIAFDSTFRGNGERYSNILRKDFSDPTAKSLAPLITLAVTHSIEHIELCLPENITTNLEFLAWVARTRKVAGMGCGNIIASDKASTEPLSMAASVTAFLLDGNSDKVWPLVQQQHIAFINSTVDSRSSSAALPRDESVGKRKGLSE